jgi:hypothetical protein
MADQDLKKEDQSVYFFTATALHAIYWHIGAEIWTLLTPSFLIMGCSGISPISKRS